ncbi:transcription elongation factor GreA [Acholeplasma equifetale]|uniref:transcription elongation factor GreA n=1 Tax=Acholeplasma equifetale TaxID=264634 RepID=UPI00047EBC84|nr:transcription elongation factor GreA [Acholeplasma equifetale]
MAVKKVYELTQAGLDQLKDELKELVEVKRKENLEAIKEARAQGDLSENADYDAARNEQARIEARIAEIEEIIKNVKIIKTNDDSSVVNIGKEVVLYFVDKDKEATYQLVGTIEANPKNGKISIDSPLGKAIRNKEEGDTVTVKSETGKSFNVVIKKVV